MPPPSNSLYATRAGCTRAAALSARRNVTSVISGTRAEAERNSPVARARTDVEQRIRRSMCAPIACSRNGDARLQPSFGSANCPQCVWPLNVSATPRVASDGQSAGLCANAITVAPLGHRASARSMSGAARDLPRDRPQDRPCRRARSRRLPRWIRCAFVHEHRAELRRAQRALDVVPAGIDVVIAGNHVHAERRVERAERARVDVDVLGAIVDQVAGDGDEIRRERVRRIARRGARKRRDVCGPTCRSESCAMRSPSNSGARPGTSTSTRRTTRPPRRRSSRARAPSTTIAERDSRRRFVRRRAHGRTAHRRATPSKPAGRHERQHASCAYQNGRTTSSRNPLAGIERPAAPAHVRDERKRRVRGGREHHEHRSREQPRRHEREHAPTQQIIPDDARGDGAKLRRRDVRGRWGWVTP